MKNFLLIFSIIVFSSSMSFSQSIFKDFDNFFAPKDSFNSVRFYSGIGIGSVFYGTGTYFLYNAWYKNNGTSKFHLFNDWGEWKNMDKVGHIYTGYNQSSIAFDAAKWTGLNEDKSLLFGVTMGMLLQSTIEVMDGFSPKWGFSLTDMASNVFGVSAFYFEQKYWGEQKITFKVSSRKISYPLTPIYSSDGVGETNLENRANDLFGTTFPQRYLKDYNAQTYWVSFNIKSLINNTRVPEWLNIAVGYSGENLFGGFSNTWEDPDGAIYSFDGEYPRHSQFLIAPDIDLRRIKVRSHFLKALLKGLNIFKIPTPAIEINTKGEFVFHLLYL